MIEDELHGWEFIAENLSVDAPEKSVYPLIYKMRQSERIELKIRNEKLKKRHYKAEKLLEEKK